MVSHGGLETMSEYNRVKKSLRQFAGINLDDGRTIPSNWVVVREEIVNGDTSNFKVSMAVFPETFSGFAKGKGQQSSGGYLGTGTKNLGIEIQVEELGTSFVGSDRTFEDITFERQNEFFNDALMVISRTITSVSDISSPQERQGSLSQVGTQRNPTDWIVGDKVNVSRPELDSGGLTVGIVVRVYPTTVDVLFPADEYHETGWVSEEEKTELIYAGHDDNWRKTANSWLNKQFYAEFDGIDINEPVPDWVGLVQSDPEGKLTTNPSPIPNTSNVWDESDEVKENLNNLLIPFRLYNDPITNEDLIENSAINGFEPYTGILRRWL
jgi:hypothetical protein